MKHTTLAVAAILASASVASAALVVNTNFEHGGSDVSGSNAAFTSTTGWVSGSGNVRYESSASDNATWSGGDADYVLIPAGKSAGGSMAGATQASGTSARGMQLDLGTSLTGTFWLSAFLRNGQTNPDGVAMLGFENGSASNSGVDHGGFGIRNGGNIATTSGTTLTDTGVAVPGAATSYKLFIAKLTVNGGGAVDGLSLWVFDQTSSFGQTEVSLGTPAYTTASIQFGDSIGDVWFGSTRVTDQSAASAFLDNLRISNLSTDEGLKEVLSGSPIPEPASLAGLALASMVVMRRRR